MNDTPASTPAERLETSVQCIKCGYDLLGLDRDTVCPECGTPVSDTARGTLLRFSDDAYLGRLQRGAFLIVASIIASILGAVALVFGAIVLVDDLASQGSTYVFEGGTAVIGLLSTIGMLAGWWFLSAPDAAYTGADEGQTPRRLVRIAVVVQACISVPNTVVAFLAINDEGGLLLASIALSLLTFVVFAVQFFASMLYLRWLGRRIPDAEVVKRAKRLLWLGPILYVLGFLTGITMLIALVMYCNVIDLVRKDIKKLRRSQAAPA